MSIESIIKDIVKVHYKAKIDLTPDTFCIALLKRASYFCNEKHLLSARAIKKKGKKNEPTKLS